MLVIGENPWTEMAPFYWDAPSEPWLEMLEPWEVEAMAAHLGIAVTDVDALCQRMRQWSSYSGEVHEGRLARRRTDNPAGRFEYCFEDGRWNLLLRRKGPRPIRSVSDRGDVVLSEALCEARIDEIDLDALCAHPPETYVYDREWHEYRGSAVASWDEWKERFERLIRSLPAETLLTVMTIA